MSSTDFIEEAGKKNYHAPHSGHHQIPTIQKYREHRDEIDERQELAEEAQQSDDDDSKPKRAFDSAKAIFKGEDTKQDPSGNPYPTANRNTTQVDAAPGEHDSSIPGVDSAQDRQNNGNGKTGAEGQSGGKSKGKDGKPDQTATEKVAGLSDPKEKRKAMKSSVRDDGGREITDPVTHLPLVIRDSTAKDAKRAPENEPSPGETTRTATGTDGAPKSIDKLNQEKAEMQEDYDGLQRVFPPPNFEDTKTKLYQTFQFALTVGMGSITALATLVLLVLIVTHLTSHVYITSAITVAVALVVGAALTWVIRGWLGKKVQGIWEDEVWDAARIDEQNINNDSGKLPESVAWMNGLLSSVWPLINPDLFASIVDMLEDVMQASLPKIIKMVSVDDLGQGSESIRILGIRWLPTGAASQTVDEEGHLSKGNDKAANDRSAPGQGEEEDHEYQENHENDSPDAKKDAQQEKAKEEEQQALREGMEAEQGDFVNMELAFSYRARSSGKSIRSKAKNAHLYLKFYLPGGVFVPVWVELKGIIGTMRLRLQLTPDPPFFSLCTLTFLGQPRVDMSCVPLSKHLPNLMNVPLISSFVQSSIDAALAEYVAPKSLTLDLKDMLVGDDFKKDTVAKGVIMVFIKSAKGFKQGDTGIGPMGGTSDSYVTCSWGKFGKTVFSTRIIQKEQCPVWHEWAFIPVTAEELNAEESLRLQLWDSDKHTADDDLGRVEVDLKKLMSSSDTKNKMCDREDRFVGSDTNENMPGNLSWSVGYYVKSRITDEQLHNQTADKDIRTKDALRKHVSKMSESKLREATAHDETKELKQQKAQDYKEREDSLICASPPDSQHSSGILSIQIHNITGLEIQSLQKRDRHNKDDGEDREDEADQSTDLPSSYCAIILNHKKIFMTRTKPKNAKPFFNAGTERFIRNWKTAEIMIGVRDAKEGENDALLGVIFLPLAKVFAKRSQVMGTYRLEGGTGFGRARVSMVFRSVEMQLPRELLGWEYGTLEIKAPVKLKGSRQDLQSHRIKFRSNISHAKMVPSDDGQWRPKHEKEELFLPCRNRYGMPLILEFRKSSLGPDSTPAFAVFWLANIVDEEEQAITVPIWKGGKDNLKRAETCAEYQGIEEGEQPIAEIELTLKFWSGLSGYHKKFAKKSKTADMRDVMEVLDTVNDKIEAEHNDDEAFTDDSEDSDSTSTSSPAGPTGKRRADKPKKLNSTTNDSDSASSGDERHGSTSNPFKIIKNKAQSIVDERQASDDGDRGPIAQMKDYKDHKKQLHRQHRGIMQWKGARTAAWAMDKARSAKGQTVAKVFDHGDKGVGIEREV
ncbi:hypothetical protein BJ878DRAFT_496988 [Calycina marina]|uniref:Uncharacterized protein n=1 Tax=Calycina marina TaxID=1763456 RepID=A0A9P7Z6W7_9HELO|nr:hypothetical protein BJ878DRAFT_496988 [Calycina marina]